jgi:hypothetical protein
MRRSLIYSWGDTLNLITFDPRIDEDGHRFHPRFFKINSRLRLESKPTDYQSRSPIIHMTVRGRLLFCSTLKDSFSILWIGESRQSVKAALSDPKPRFSTTHFLAEDGESIVADKEGQLVGLIADGILPPLAS